MMKVREKLALSWLTLMIDVSFHDYFTIHDHSTFLIRGPDVWANDSISRLNSAFIFKPGSVQRILENI